MDTSNVTNMSQMFLNCRSLKELNLSSFNTNSVQDMSQMFSGCSDLRMLNITNFDTKKVTNMNGMFAGCETLEELDLSNFDTKNVKSMDNMFQSSDALKSLKLGEKFVVPKNKEHNLKLVNRTWVDVGTGTIKNPKPTNKEGISSVELLKHHDKGNWVVKPEKAYQGDFKLIIANNLNKDIVMDVPEDIRPEYIGSSFEMMVPQIIGYNADKKILHVTATDKGLISDDKVNYTKIESEVDPRTVTFDKPVEAVKPAEPVTPKVQPTSSVQLAEKVVPKPEKKVEVQPAEKTETKVETKPEEKEKPAEKTEPTKPAVAGKVSKFMHYVTVHPDIQSAQTYNTNGQINKGDQLRQNYSWFSDKQLQIGAQKYYHVVGDSWIKAEDVYRYQEFQNIVKTKDVVMTHLVNSRAEELTNRGLGALSTWQTSKEALIGDHKYYQITTNEFVDADSVDLMNA